MVIAERKGVATMLNKRELVSTYSFLREATMPWKIDTRKSGGNKCSLTGTKVNVQVHHKNRSFIEIIEETFTELGIEYKNEITDYTSEEKRFIQEKCLELHRKYGPGVLVCERLHTRFHIEYGVTGYTPENWKEFKQRLRVQQSTSRKFASK